MVSSADWQHPGGPKSDLGRKRIILSRRSAGMTPSRLPSGSARSRGGRCVCLLRRNGRRQPEATDGRIYPWGNAPDAARLNSAEGGPGDTTPVGKYSSAGDSPYGAADMAGNVWSGWRTGTVIPNTRTAPHGSIHHGSNRAGEWRLPGGAGRLVKQLTELRALVLPLGTSLKIVWTISVFGLCLPLFLSSDLWLSALCTLASVSPLPPGERGRG